MTRQHEIGGVTFHGELAEAASSISREEWAYFDLVDSLSDQIAEYMEETGISKAELAKRMGTSRALVTKVLSGDSNMTLKTLSKILHHLGAKPEIKIIGDNDQVTWFKVLGKDKTATLQTPIWYAAAGPSRSFQPHSAQVCVEDAA